MTETVFTYAAPALKFGRGASRELGYDLTTWGAQRVLLVTDPGVAAAGHPAAVFSTTYDELLALTGATPVDVGPDA